MTCLQASESLLDRRFPFRRTFACTLDIGQYDHLSFAVGHPIDSGVMHDHQLAVHSRPQIDLDIVGSRLDGNILPDDYLSSQIFWLTSSALKPWFLSAAFQLVPFCACSVVG
jgi:hypothetical protein